MKCLTLIAIVQNHTVISLIRFSKPSVFLSFIGQQIKLYVRYSEGWKSGECRQPQMNYLNALKQIHISSHLCDLSAFTGASLSFWLLTKCIWDCQYSHEMSTIDIFWTFSVTDTSLFWAVSLSSHIFTVNPFLKLSLRQLILGNGKGKCFHCYHSKRRSAIITTQADNRNCAHTKKRLLAFNTWLIFTKFNGIDLIERKIARQLKKNVSISNHWSVWRK